MSDAAEAPVIPPAETKGGVVPYLNVDGAVAAADFYVKAFGATIATQAPPDASGRTMHIHLHINGSSVMLSDFYPEHGFQKVAPQAFSLVLMVDDIHARYQRAVDAGAVAITQPDRMFWGDIYGELRDPFGITWGMNQPG